MGRSLFPPVQETYGISASEELWLSGSAVVASEHLLSRWINNHVGALEHESEALSSGAFFVRIGTFLRAVRLTRIDYVKLDRAEVCKVSDDPKITDNLNDALAKAAVEAGGLQHLVDQHIILAEGKAKDFAVTMKVSFSSIHRLMHPGIVIRIQAVPHHLARKTGESDFDWDSRAYSILNDKQARTNLEEECRPFMESLLDNYEHALREYFDVKKIDRTLRAHFNDTVL